MRIDPSIRRRQQGRTLVELMVAITIGLVILLALGTVYLATTSTGRQSTAVTRMSEDAAVALGFFGSDLRMAGFSAPRSATSGGSALIGGEQVSVAARARNFTGAGIRGCDHGFDSVTADFDLLTCQTADPTRPAAVAFRFEGSVYQTGSGANLGYVSNTVPISGNPSDCLNNAVTTTHVTPSGSSYYLVESRYTAHASGSSATPELFCAGNGGTSANVFASHPLMQFVEDTQIRYGVARNSLDRDVAYYATAAQVDALSGTADVRWSRVVNARVCMVMRSQGRDQAGAGNYIDCDGNSVASADGYARRAFTTVYALRNRSGFLTP